MKFQIADYIVFILTIGISFSIGIFFAIWERKRNTPVDYFLAGRKSRTWPVALSFVVTFQSSLLVLGFPAEGYAYGIGIGYNIIGATAAYILAALLIVPVFHPLKLTSVNEYFQLRYGNNSVRYVTLVAGIFFSLFYMATVMVGTCFALDVVLGMPFWGTILIYTIVTTLYTSMGGIKAVIWTDVFQFVVMLSGMLAVLIKSSIDSGGFDKVLEYSKERIKSTNFSFDPTIRYQVWNTSFGTFSAYLYLTLMQPAMQRVYSTPNVKTARNLYFISTPIYSLVLLIATFEGPAIFAYYVVKRCDILEAGLVDNINEILPFAVMDLFQQLPGLAGLFTASLSSASLSTMSSCLSSLSAVTYEDVIKINFPDMQADKATRLSKIIVLLYGLLALALAFAVSQIPGSVVAIFFGFMGSLDGPVVGIFLLSIMFRRSTAKGVITGAFCGCAVAFWLNIGSHFSSLSTYPYLHHGPTDQCNNYLSNDISNVKKPMQFSVLAENLTDFPFTQQPTAFTLIMATTTNEDARLSSNLSLLQTIYSISYVMFSFIGMLTSLMIGCIVSLCTSSSHAIDERCLFSFRKHFVGELCWRKTSPDHNLPNVVELVETTSFLTENVEFEN